jgi:hypothetical protein
MKLADHVDTLRNLIDAAFDKQFARLGIGKSRTVPIEKLPEEHHKKRQRYEEILNSHIDETGDYKQAREKLIDELTFTLFNRLAALKVMEAAALLPPVLTKRPEHGDRSFGHKAWLEINPHMHSEELEGIREYIIDAFNEIGAVLPLYSKEYPYALLPDAISLNEIIDAFNAVEKDIQVGRDIWQSDDVLGWMYESYNNVKKKIHKDSGDKTEYNKVSLQSQVYTPRWVVQFLVDNSLGKLYLEMYPGSDIKKRYKIANVGGQNLGDRSEKLEEKAMLSPNSSLLTPNKKLHEIKLIDPACGSGNFLLYAFDFFYELYVDQIDNYGADYDVKDIPRLIIENNLHGIDLDDRAVQLAQLGLFIKAKKKRRNIGELTFNVVSSDFFLPDYDQVRLIFESETTLDNNQKELIADIWSDLQSAHKFGSLIRLDEKLDARFNVLQALVDKGEYPLFANSLLECEKNFAATFFTNLKTAVEQYAQAEGSTFLTSKTRDAITFLELLTTKYDVATANPPYTDSADFGPELKTFIENNYKKPYKFHTNLYATFIKRCYDFTGDAGFVAMVHPPTFMYIKTFEDVRKFMIDKTHINFFVEWGYLGMFNPSARVDSALYILEKNNNQMKDAVFVKLNHLYETKRYDALFEAYEIFLAGGKHELLYTIPQSKLKIIKSWPFIYWISDEFREKFGGGGLSADYQEISVGMQMPGNNEMHFRFPWEIFDKDNYSRYTKGGVYNNWYGNDWLIVPTSLLSDLSVTAANRQRKFGVSSSRTSTKGASFRFKDTTTCVDNNTINVFTDESEEVFYLLGLLNSKVNHYVFDCLNPTVHVQAGDLQRVPRPKITTAVKSEIITSAKSCVSIKRRISEYCLSEPDFKKSPFLYFTKNDFKQSIIAFHNYENHLLTQVLVCEAIINEKIFEVYDLTAHDKAMVLAKEGESIGGLPVSPEARDAYLSETEATKEFPLDNIRDFIASLPTNDFSAEERDAVEQGFPVLYQSNNDLEEFCIRHQVNPINVWYWFKMSNVIPQQRMRTLAMEILVDMVREILMDDEDGIIPLVPNAGEKILLDRIEDKFHEKGFSTAQYSSFDRVLGRPIHEYLNKHFFADLSDHLNLFMYLPKTPFIWHLTSGPERGFDCYIIIYKWSRDKMMRLRSVYIEHRERALINRQSDLAGNDSAEAQNENDRISRQLKEIDVFRKKIDELLAEGYNPILDDGVGKNIAPLQKKKMIAYDVLNAGQLKKYLNADW